MRIHVNRWCNLVTGPDANSVRFPAEITIPAFRARLTMEEAKALSRELKEAADKAENVLAGGLHACERCQMAVWANELMELKEDDIPPWATEQRQPSGRCPNCEAFCYPEGEER